MLPFIPADFTGLVNKLSQVGIDYEFLLERLLSSTDAARASGDVAAEDDGQVLVAKATAILQRVYGWSQENIFSAEPLSVPRFAAAEARFKMPAGRTKAATSLYAVYANYLAVVALNGSSSLSKRQIPTDASLMHRYILDRGGMVDLRNALHAAWDLGVVVLPLRDHGRFHGACWRYEGRNVIVLKQKSGHEARWLFDLIHELFHAATRPNTDTLEVIEADETAPERRNSDEEIAASQFAGEVILNGKAELLAQECVQVAHNSVEQLKRVVPKVAVANDVDVGALANYLAFRLSWQGINWWGAAANLQAGDTDPYTIARDVFVERFPYEIDNELDCQLLNRALQ